MSFTQTSIIEDGDPLARNDGSSDIQQFSQNQVLKQADPVELEIVRVPSPADHGPADVGSSETWTNTGRSSSYVRPQSTRATSVSNVKQSIRSFSKAALVGDRILEEVEPSPSEEVINSHTTRQVGDGGSTVSVDSVELNAAQKDDIISRFSNAVLEKILPQAIISDAVRTPNATFHSQFQNLLKAYSDMVKASTSEQSKRKASKAIHILRREISQQCEETFCGFGPPKNTRVYPNIVKEAAKVSLPEKTVKEKFQDWKCDLTSVLLFTDQGDALASQTCPSPSTEDDEQSDSGSGVEGIYPPGVEDENIHNYLTTHPAFSDLVIRLKRLLERHYCNQMMSIRHRLLLGIRRTNTWRDNTSGDYQVMFRIDWDILSFLRSQYDIGTAQDLQTIVTITGESVNAQLATVQYYFTQTWSNHTFTLIDAIQSAIHQSQESSWTGMYTICCCCIYSIGSLAANQSTKTRPPIYPF
jgi:hypothetical protein